MKPLNIAHRGAPAHAPENTLAAFRLAIELGSDGLEFDVQMTRDGVPVVIHDERLKRTTGAEGLVADCTWKEIDALDAGIFKDPRWKGEKIPTLEEVLSEFSGTFLNIELKNSEIPYEGLEEKVIHLVHHYCSPANVILSSFNHSSVKRLKDIAPHIKTGALYTKEPVKAADYVLSLDATAAHPEYLELTLEKINQFHSAGLIVNTWTVNEKEDMQRLIEFEVDGIITNYPDRLRECMDGKR